MFLALRRIWTSISAQFSKTGRWAVNKDPIAVREAKVEQAAGQVEKDSQSLIEYEGVVDGLRRELSDAQKEEAELRGRIQRQVTESKASGDASVRQLALDNAKRLAVVQTRIASLNEKLTRYTDGYNKSLETVKAEKQQVKDQKAKTIELKVDLNLSQTEARMSTLSARINSSDAIGGIGEVDDQIHQQIDRNKAAVKVMADLGDNDMAKLRDDKHEQDLKAEELLKQFEK